MDLPARRRWLRSHEWISIEELINAWQIDTPNLERQEIFEIIEDSLTSDENPDFPESSNGIKTAKQLVEDRNSERDEKDINNDFSRRCFDEKIKYRLSLNDKEREEFGRRLIKDGDDDEVRLYKILKKKPVWMSQKLYEKRRDKKINKFKLDKFGEPLSKSRKLELSQRPDAMSGREGEVILSSINKDGQVIPLSKNHEPGPCYKITDGYPILISSPHDFIMVGGNIDKPGELGDELEIAGSELLDGTVTGKDGCQQYTMYGKVPYSYRLLNTDSQKTYRPSDIFLMRNLIKPLAYINPTGYAKYLRAKGYESPPMLSGEVEFMPLEVYDPCAVIKLAMKAHKHFSSLPVNPLHKNSVLNRRTKIRNWIEAEHMKVLGRDGPVKPTVDDIDAVVRILTLPKQRITKSQPSS